MDESSTASLTVQPETEKHSFTCYVYSIVIFGAVTCLICFISFVGNILAFVTWLKVGLRKGMNSSIVLMLFLAVADFMTNFPMLLVVSLPTIATQTTVLQDYLCNYYPFVHMYLWPFSSMGNFCTIWLTTLITVHRFAVLSKPFSRITRRIVTVRATAIQASVVVVSSVAFSTVRFFELNLDTYERKNWGTCLLLIATNLTKSKSYNFGYFTVSYLILVNAGPILLCIVLTVKIVQLLIKAKASRSAMTGGGNTGNTRAGASSSNNTASSSNNKASASSSSSSSSKESAVTRTLLTVIIIFIVCQLPDTCWRIFTAFYPGLYLTCGSAIFFLNPLALLFVTVNSSINIFIYIHTSTQFRKMLGYMLCCGCCRKKEEDVFSNTLATNTSNNTRASVDNTTV